MAALIGMGSAPDSSRSPGLAELAEEFRRLEATRRVTGLVGADSERYYSLFARLSEMLASGERNRRADQRQFLRLPTDCTLVIRDTDRELRVACRDFGGGGCFFVADVSFDLGDTVWVDGAILDGKHYPLHGRANVVWLQLASHSDAGYGIRFVLECDEFRDQIDRLFYRVLDLVLTGGSSKSEHGTRRERKDADAPAPVQAAAVPG